MSPTPVKKKKPIQPPARSSELLHNRYELSEKHVWIIVGVVAALMAYWMSQSPRPYDDDNIGRYFMAQEALHKPEFLVNTWGRPLGILLFLIPSQMGYWYCAGLAIVLSALTCYVVYRTAVVTGRANAWLAVVFTAFQPVFFSTSFSLCTEPIAAFFLALGLFYFYRKQYGAACVLLSLTPLARLELIVLFPYFAYTLIREKRYVPMLLLGTGLLVFQVGGMILVGDPLYLLSQIQGAGHGLYQNGPFDHYFKRFIFIVGPTLFVFLLYQLIDDIRQRRVTLTNLSLVTIFCMHVYFYWKGNVAQIGFLRHFVAIAPIITLMALDGFNLWFEDKPEREKQERNISLLVLSGLALIVLFFYPYDLIGDYFIGDDKDTVKFLLVGLLGLLFVLNKFVGMRDGTTKQAMLLAVVAATIGYTVVKQKPLQLAPEHQTVRKFYSYYQEHIKPQHQKMMVVHTWFFFFDNYNYYQDKDSTTTLWEMRKENLEKLPVGGYVAWDSHYSWRLVSDVQESDLVNNPKFKLTEQFVTPDRRFGILLFEKIQS